jgi:hypothetical protein
LPSSGTEIKPEYRKGLVPDPALGFLRSPGSGLLRTWCGLKLVWCGVIVPPACSKPEDWLTAVGVGVEDDEPDDEVGLWFALRRRGGEEEEARRSSVDVIIPPLTSAGLGLALIWLASTSSSTLGRGTVTPF